MNGEQIKALVGDRDSLVIGPRDPERVRRDVESEPPIRDMRPRSQIFLAFLSFVTTFLLLLGLVTGWVPLLLVHFVAQFMLVLVVGTVLWEDESIDQASRTVWVAAFLLMAPIAVPAYVVMHVLGHASPEAQSAYT